MTELVGQGRPFYSAMDMGAKALKRKVGTGSEFLKELMGLPGVKPTELKERGLEHLMNEPKMTHGEFLGHLAKKPAPKIKEKVLGSGASEDAINEMIDRDAEEYANDVVGGHSRQNSAEWGEVFQDYADRAYNLRYSHYKQKADELVKKGLIDPEVAHENYTLPGGENYREMLIKDPKGEFKGVYGHFHGEPNILASMRLKDRTGPNGENLLHLEELQSDWHQQGRDKGYGRKLVDMPKMSADELLNEHDDNLKPEQKKYLKDFMNKWESAEYNGRENDLSNLTNQYQDWVSKQTIGSGVPDAPFKKNWEEMAIKRLIHHAAEKGYHGIVVTPGKEQADRYRLTQYINDVQYDPKVKHLTAQGKKGEAINKIAEPNELPNYVGKELAEKLLQTELNQGRHKLSGLDLQTGGEGMKGFYDKKVPNIFNTVGKKHGVTMQLHGHQIETEPSSGYQVRNKLNPNSRPTNFMHLTDAVNWRHANNLLSTHLIEPKPAKYAQLHHFPISEPMREDVLKNGLPLYNTGGVIHKAEGGNVQPSIEQMRMALQNKGTFPKYGIQSIGAEEAPDMSPKYYIEPGKDGHPSVGGVDMDKITPGMQLVQQDAQAMQPPQGTPIQGTPPQASGNVSSPLGAPPQGGQSNILNMTPQGQALGAMAPPQPQGMATGGSMHYAPSRPLSKSEISDMAERMVRQSKGLEMPSTTTKQQFEREKNLPIDIRKSGKEIQQPIIDYSQHLGASSVGVPGDPSRGGLVPSTNKKGFPVAKAGETLRGIGGQKLESPVGLFGGYKYGAYGHPIAWASDLGASAGMFNVVKKLAEENPDAEILGHYHKMTPESLHHAVHMLHTVLSHHQPHNLNDEHIALLDHLMKKVAITKGKNDIPYPEFPGFKKPEEVMLHGSLKSGMRKKIIKLLGTEKYFPGGKQKMDDIMYAISHPELRNMETGSGGSAIIRFDPTIDLKSTQSLHPTYGHDIPSKLIGRTRYITPAHILAPRSMANAEREIKAMGKKVVPFNQAKMNIIREPIDEQYVNQMGEYEHEMKKRLGYKKGGKVANMDTMRLELSRKTKKA